MLSCEFCENSKNIFSTEHPRTTTSGEDHDCTFSVSFKDVTSSVESAYNIDQTFKNKLGKFFNYVSSPINGTFNFFFIWTEKAGTTFTL